MAQLRSYSTMALRGAAALLLAAALVNTTAARAASADSKRLQQLTAGPQRTAENKARDAARNPVPLLAFLKVTPQSHVIEILPGREGYWTEILAPYLRDYGRYSAAIPKADPARAETMAGIAGYKEKLTANPIYYQRVATIDFTSRAPDLGPPASADFVLTFRNLHNWMATGNADVVIAAMYKVLKKGGVLGIEEHRGLADTPQDPLAKSGYVRQDFAIEMIEKAGFKFTGSSEINANPKDTKDYAAGVWALPPTYRLKDQDRAKYLAIGESDRFVLKFAKQ